MFIQNKGWMSRRWETLFHIGGGGLEVEIFFIVIFRFNLKLKIGVLKEFP